MNRSSCGWTNSCAKKRTRGNHCLLVSIGVIIIPGFLRWCRISSIHSMALRMRISFHAKPFFLKPAQSESRLVDKATGIHWKLTPTRCVRLFFGGSHPFLVAQRLVASAFNGRPNPSIGHQEGGWGLKTRLFEGPKSIELEPLGGAKRKLRSILCSCCWCFGYTPVWLAFKGTSKENQPTLQQRPCFLLIPTVIEVFEPLPSWNIEGTGKPETNENY